MSSPDKNKAEEEKPAVFGGKVSSTMFGGSSSTGSTLFGAALPASSTGGLFGNTTPFNFGGESAAFGALPAKQTTGGEEDEDGEGEGSDNDADESHAADFKPVVHLSMIEVKTGEDEEEAVFKQRAKLYVFVKEDSYGGETRRDYWKERGLGEIKLLKHRVTGEYRLLMRQDKTLKIAANHRVDPACELKRNSEKSFVFSAMDFANDEGVAKKEVFSVRFGQAEEADKFEKVFAEAKQCNAKAEEAGVKPAAAAAKPVSEPVAAAAAKPVSEPVAAAPAPVVTAVKPAEPVVAAAKPAPVVAAAAPVPAVSAVKVGAFSTTEDVFKENVRALGRFAASKIGKGTLVRIASCKSQVVAGKNYRMALHILYKDSDEVHAHVVTVFEPLPHEAAASGPVLLDEVHTARIF